MSFRAQRGEQVERTSRVWVALWCLLAIIACSGGREEALPDEGAPSDAEPVREGDRAVAERGGADTLVMPPATASRSPPSSAYIRMVLQTDAVSGLAPEGGIPPAEVLIEPRQEWWARVLTPDGRMGWLWMNRTPRMGGADACG